MDYNDLGVTFKYLIVNAMDQKYGLSVNTVGFQSILPAISLMRKKAESCVNTSLCI